MKRKRRCLTAFLAVFLTAFLAAVPLLAACAAPAQSAAPEGATDTVEITFAYEKQPGYASNQFAVWIEDAEGTLVKTLYATRFTAHGGWKDRPDSLPDWVEKSGLAGKDRAEIDALTGATPKAGVLTYRWDCADALGDPVPPGAYRFLVEGSLRWAMRALYTGEIQIGGGAATAEATAAFFGDDGAERTMIRDVTASYTPQNAD
jgi:hypothetical protein